MASEEDHVGEGEPIEYSDEEQEEMEPLEGTPQELHAAGMQLMKEGNIPEAIHHFSTALENAREEGMEEGGPESAAYYLAHADAVLKEYEEQQCEGSFDFVQASEDDLEEYQNAWDMFDIARIGLEKRRAQKPDDVEAAQLLILCHMRMGDHKTLDEDFEVALGEYQTSLKYAEEHAGGEPNRIAEVLFPLGVCFTHLDRLADALPVFERTLACLQKHSEGLTDQAEKERFAEICNEVKEKIAECSPEAVEEAEVAMAEVAKLTEPEKKEETGFSAPTRDGPTTTVQVKRKAKGDGPPAKAPNTGD